MEPIISPCQNVKADCEVSAYVTVRDSEVLTTVSAGPFSRPCCVGRDILKEHLAMQLKAQALDIAFFSAD